VNNNNRYEMGGAVFSLSIFWTQIFPFVALQFYEDTDDHTGHEHVHGIINFLAGSAMLWMVLNIIFLCTIDMSLLPTFFSTKTAP